MPIGSDGHVLNMYVTERMKFFLFYNFYYVFCFILKIYFGNVFCWFPSPYLFGKKEFQTPEGNQIL